MSENEIIKVYNEGMASVISLVKDLTQKIDSLNSEIASLNQRVQSLESQVNKNSNNSSKPPSSDGFKKTKSLRKPSGKSPGGQEGHKGHTLERVDNPDNIIEYNVDQCSKCGASLKDIIVEKHIVRQVVDLPETKVVVTEHRADVKQCPYCGHTNIAAFPEGVTQPVQYGNKLKATSVYLSQYQLIPYDRQEQFFKDLFNHDISKGTLVSINKACYGTLENIEANIKSQLTASTGVVHFDETGVSINGKLKWLHVASNDKYTYYAVHDKRGSKATDDIGILPDFKGTAVHDSWKSYNKYTNCDHSLCCAHILRELNGITELEKQSWADEMKQLLLEIKFEVDKAPSTQNALMLKQVLEYENKYDAIVSTGMQEDFKINPPTNEGKHRRKKSKSGNLLERLTLHKQEILSFMNDFDIPFDNNQAERDIRMTKVKQKISGTFRTFSGAEHFARIRGYISTLKKQSKSVIDCIESLFSNNPFDPTLE